MGTEVHLVHRLAEEVAPEKTVLSLDQFGCLCSTMFRVSPNHLLWVLDGLVDGEVHNHIVVPENRRNGRGSRWIGCYIHLTEDHSSDDCTWPTHCPPLPYDFAALEPHIDAQTMQIHHGKHHQAYVTNLNAALDKHPELHDKSLDDLIKGLNSVPEDIRTAVRNNGGGHWNHSLFWKLMGPNAGGAPTGAVADGDQCGLRQLRQVQGTVPGRRHGPLRQRLGVAGRQRRQARDHQHAEPGQPADGRQEGHPRRRRLGTRVLPEVPEPARRLPRRVVERRQLGRSEPAAEGIEQGHRQEAQGRTLGSALCLSSYAFLRRRLRLMDDSFQLYDLRVEVVATDRPMVCSHRAGDWFEVEGENLSFPDGQAFSIYALAALLPLLPAKQRRHARHDWMTTDTDIACPDPHCGARFRITRTGVRTFRHSEVTAVPLPRGRADRWQRFRASPSRRATTSHGC